MTSQSDSSASTTIEANSAALWLYFLRRVHHPDDAADLLGSTFVALWVARRKMPLDPVEARMWCFGVARNIVREHHRALGRTDALTSALVAQLSTGAQTALSDPAERSERDERSREVRAALNRLRPKPRELMILIHWDGFTLTEAARHLGLNESSARSRYSRARIELAAHLNLHAPPGLPRAERECLGNPA